jgi:hypothetical protein
VSGRAVQVEFLGLPGVGKSSVSRRVAEILAAKGLPVRQPTYTLDHGPGKLERTLRKSLYVIGEVLSHPHYSLLSAKALRDSRQESFHILFKMLFNWLLVSAMMRRHRTAGGIHLYDQGIFQGLWSIGLGAKNGAIRLVGDRLAPWIPAPTVVAVVEADLSTVTRRLEERGGRHSRADAWRAQDAEMFARSSSLLEETKGLVRTPIRVIPIQNDRDSDLEANAALLARNIEEILRESTP